MTHLSTFCKYHKILITFVRVNGFVGGLILGGGGIGFILAVGLGGGGLLCFKNIGLISRSYVTCKTH